MNTEIFILFVDEALQGGSLAAEEILSRRAAAARRLQRAYSGTAVLTCTLWLVLTAAQYVRTRTVDFPFWLPAAADKPYQSVSLSVLCSQSYYSRIRQLVKFHRNVAACVRQPSTTNLHCVVRVTRVIFNRLIGV